MLGIIGAMDEEVAKIKERLENVEVQTFGGMDFYKGNFEGKSVVVVRSGIGKVNAAVCAQILADRYQVSGIVNTGIAGSLMAKIDIGDIVLSTDALQHDMDATNFGYPAGQIPRMDVLSFPADPKLLLIAVQVVADHPEGHGVIHLALLFHADHRKPHPQGYPADHIPVPLPGPYTSCYPVPADPDFCAVQLLDILRPDHRAAAKKPAIEQIRKAAVVLKISCR